MRFLSSNWRRKKRKKKKGGRTSSDVWYLIEGKGKAEDRVSTQSTYFSKPKIHEK
jgi:hypothetical protein